VNLAKAIGTVLLLFLATYTPAFFLVLVLRLPPLAAAPVIIGASLAVAMLLMYLRVGSRFSKFGFRLCAPRYIVIAVVVGVPVGWGFQVLINCVTGPLMPEPSFPIWITMLYFVVGAAIQEEVIFRGLLQSTLARQFPKTLAVFGTSLSWAAIIVAVLFGVIHLKVNVITGVAAFALGLLAGELRNKSGSLLSAAVVHAIFNLFAALALPH
jgi:membrane protease YdiL (CAAX protease family)